MPASRFSSVVLPLPDRPTTATNSLAAMSRLTWSTATTSPALNGYALTTSLTWIACPTL